MLLASEENDQSQSDRKTNASAFPFFNVVFLVVLMERWQIDAHWSLTF